MLLIIDIMVASIDDLEMLFCRSYSYHNLDVMSKIHKKNMINIMKWRTRTYAIAYSSFIINKDTSTSLGLSDHRDYHDAFRSAAVVKQVHEDLDATFQEQYDNLCQLQQEEDAVMERMEKLKAEAHAANDGIEQQVGLCGSDFILGRLTHFAIFSFPILFGF